MKTTSPTDPITTETSPQVRFSVTWDHDFLVLWCVSCAEDSEEPVDMFAGNPTDMDEIGQAVREHVELHERTSS